MSHTISNCPPPRNKTVYYLASSLKHHTYSETDMNTNRHTTPCLYRGQTHVQTTRLNQLAIKLCRKHWWQIMEISSMLFVFQTTELISQSLQPSQNPAKDPRGTPEHRTSILLRRRPWDLDLSSRIGEALLHTNPTCGVEAELGFQNATETALD